MPPRRELTFLLMLTRHECLCTRVAPFAVEGILGVSALSLCPLFSQISFFSLLSVLCVMLSMAGSVLSCKNAQLARDFQECNLVRSEEGEPECTSWGRRVEQLGLSGFRLPHSLHSHSGWKGLCVLPLCSSSQALSRVGAGAENCP